MKKTFYSLILVFILIISYFIFSDGEYFAILAVLGFLFFILGIILILKARKLRRKKLKKYLIITGASASGVLIGVILHNLVYALIIYFNPGFQGDEAFFFFMALFVCPILFLVGVIGSFKHWK